MDAVKRPTGSADGWAVVDGRGSPLAEAVLPVTDLGLLRGWSVFETLGWPASDVHVHLRRLAASCEEVGLPMPSAHLLEAEVREAGERSGTPSSVRITVTGSGHRVVAAQPMAPTRRHEPVRCVRGPHVDDPFVPGSVKHGSRMGWEVAVARSGADDVLRVAEGRFTEGTRAGVIAVIDGVLTTAPHDGRILASTTVERLVGHAERLGIPVRWEGPPAAGGWDALYVASSTRSLAPVVELDGEALPGWCPVGRRLAAADDAWAER